MPDHAAAVRPAAESSIPEGWRLTLPSPPRPLSVPARTDIDDGCGVESIAILTDGIACLYRILSDGSRRILALILPGEFCCGPHPDARPLGYAVGTLTGCTIARLPPRATMRLARDGTTISEALRSHVVLKVSAMQEWLCNAGRGSDKQLAHIFCELHVRLQAIGLADETGYDLDITQADLADMVGISPVHANRVLKALARKRLVTWKCRRVEIPDAGRLKVFAGFSAHYLSECSPHALGLDA
ncbi:Crp/Fnr family transcriptional regulator [Methylobacterium sp. JK268]